MKLELTEDQQDAVILTILKRDLQNQIDELDELEGNTQAIYRSTYRSTVKKNIKMLKRVINFYSVMDEY